MIKTTMLHDRYIVNADDLQKCLEAEQKGNRQLMKLLDLLIEQYEENIEKQTLLTRLCIVKTFEYAHDENEELAKIYLRASTINEAHAIGNELISVMKKNNNEFYNMAEIIEKRKQAIFTDKDYNRRIIYGR